MNNLTEESGLGECLICLSKIENYDVLLPGQEYQKIVNNCWNYLHENIANSKLQIVTSENENELPLCKICFDAASELFKLSEGVIKSQKKISDLKFEFSLGALARRTKVESVKNVSDCQNSPKEFIVLEVSRILSPSVFSTDQHKPNPPEMDDFAPPCENNLTGMDVAAIDSQYLLEIVKHESKEVADDESTETEDNANMTKDEELSTYTQPVIVLKGLKEANVSEKLNSKSSPQQPPSNHSSLNHRLRNKGSKKKVAQSTSSNIIYGKTGIGNVKKVKKSASSLKVPSLFSTVQPNPTEIDDFAHPCENNFTGMDLNGMDPQHIFEIVKHQPKETVDDESAESEDNTNITRDEELPAYTRPVIVLQELIEAVVSKQFNSNSTFQHPPLNPPTSSLTSKKKVEQSSPPNIIHGKTGTGNLKKVKKSASSLKVPGRVDTGKKEHKCHVCGKVFPWANNLLIHIRIHTGEKPFKCSFCGKGFSQMGTLKAHERIHTGEKPFKCSFCVKVFSRSSYVLEHEKVHTGERPFKCSFCRKTFVQSNGLKYHLRVHTGKEISFKI